jgi:3-methyladenine DNA glycosylase AlkD
MTLQEAMSELESLGNATMRKMYEKEGAPEKLFGVKMGDIRNVAKKIKSDHDLALQLWETGNADARLLAVLVMKPKQLSEDELEEMVADTGFSQLADWMTSYVVKQHPAKETLRQRWMHTDHRWLARAGWSLTKERVSKDPDGLDLAGLLDRIEKEMGGAPEATRWTMNFCLIAIGIENPELRPRAIEISEQIGAYRDFPCSKGCVSPFAATCIPEMVSRGAHI